MFNKFIKSFLNCFLAVTVLLTGMIFQSENTLVSVYASPKIYYSSEITKSEYEEKDYNKLYEKFLATKDASKIIVYDIYYNYCLFLLEDDGYSFYEAIFRANQDGTFEAEVYGGGR